MMIFIVQSIYEGLGFGQGKLRMSKIKLNKLFRYCMKLFKFQNYGDLQS